MWKPKSTNIEASYGSIWGNYYNEDLTFYKWVKIINDIYDWNKNLIQSK